MTITRRHLLRAGLSGLALAAPLSRLAAAEPRGQGALAPVADEATGLPLLALPPGFSYTTFGWTGDPLDDGTPTPDRHDGMAVVAQRRDGTLVIARNHERGLVQAGDALPVVGGEAVPVYDPWGRAPDVTGFGGGTTAVEYRDGRLVSARATLGGTLVNCAGGPTPWGSWLSCEEIVVRGGEIGARDHGYVFEVPLDGAASARPIKAMGLMKHEAVALDPGTGIAYLTEDSKPRSGFYRYLPEDRSGRPGSLEQGGRLEMLRIRDHAGSDLREPREGRRLAVDWVPIGEPDADPESFVYATPALPPIVGAGRSGPFMQGEAAGGATFGRLEGCWYHQGAVYFTDTIGGRAETGCVWAYVPAEESLVAVHVSAGEHESDHVDNLTVSPDGLIVVCEDGAGRRDMLGRLTGGTRLLVVDAAGGVAALAENHVVLERSPQGRPLIAPGDYRDQEWCGACFSPDGETLFANVQTPGITVAIRGPWERFRYAG